MGRMIDADKFEAFVIRTNGDEEFVNGVQYVLEKIDNAPTVEAIPKADYEARLKADLKAILVELQLEIHELENPYPHDYDNLLLLAQHNAFYDAKSTIEDLVDEKIKED